MDFGIKGKWALVCGASKGLGLGCAQALAGEGVHVVMVARGREVLEASAAALRQASPGVQVIAVVADITTPEGRAAAFAAPGGPGTAFDIVVTNAGGPPPGDFRSWDREAWIKAVDANMLTPIELIKATVDGMAARGFGRIVNITSSVVRHPIDVQGLSAAARAGLHGLVSTLVRDHVGRNVTINNILPGPFATDRLISNFTFRAKQQGISAEQALADRRAELPAGRFGDPKELGQLCAFLCSASAGYISGQSILIDGGAHPQIL